MVAAAASAGKRERKVVERLVQAAPEPIKKKAKTAKAKAKAAPAKGKKAAAPKKEGKAKKDPNAPKRGLSAFMFFSNDNREKIKKENPGCSFGEVGKYLGEAWSKADAKTKKKYEEQAAKDKARYEKEMAKYKK